MQKIELKFQIPKDKRELIFKALQRKTVQHKTLKTQYLDSKQFDLSQHSILLKQRLENDEWLKKLQALSLKPIQLFEIDEDLTSIENKNQLAHYHKIKNIPEKIQKWVTEIEAQLIVQFETEIERSTTLFNFQNSQIIVELDRGFMHVNQAQFEIYEVKFKLKQGTIQDLISFILPRVKRYGLWLDTRNKVQQGFQLVQNIQESPTQLQIPLNLDKSNSTEIALKKVIYNCLQHLLPNSTAIASGHFNSDHIHQVRVAIRRLRSALKTFANWSQHIDLCWETELTNLFRSLGRSRDLSMIHDEILPKLEMLNAPKIQLEIDSLDENNKISSLFKSLNFESLVLSLIQFIYQNTNEQSSKSVKKTIHKNLDKLHQSIKLDAENFLSLEIEARHRTRKRLKRLRYSLEFISSLYDEHTVKGYIKRLKPAQESLGKYNDFIVAENRLKPYAPAQPEVWFALGWIAAEKQHLLIQSQQDLLHFAQAIPFWK
ncbi:CYTH and CHAD domain-containing protein [Acinetobacter piscicola]|uniref:CYTH and CHAD domain-containing protein n=1 Tax=Acinetobacter piscicola TaxID=2006115 RepID=UPI000B7F90B2|nr:CHAD domain-containing protein [Acinetobacter piscicola]